MDQMNLDFLGGFSPEDTQRLRSILTALADRSATTTH
jgi:hypothetical protein